MYQAPQSRGCGAVRNEGARWRASEPRHLSVGRVQPGGANVAIMEHGGAAWAMQTVPHSSPPVLLDRGCAGCEPSGASSPRSLWCGAHQCSSSMALDAAMAGCPPGLAVAGCLPALAVAQLRLRAASLSAASLGCHGTRYVPNARGWYAYPVRTVRGALGASRPAPPVRTQRGRLVRVACTYPTEARGRTRQLGLVLVLAATRVLLAELLRHREGLACEGCGRRHWLGLGLG